jgi:opacity protein-like surface antigen
MGSLRSRAFGVALLACCALAGIAVPAVAQDIEPRAYSNAPVGVNFLIAGYAYTDGGLSFDSALSASNPELTTSNFLLGCARVLDIAGKSIKLYGSSGLSARTGNSFDLLGIAWQYRWGGGL